MIAVDPGSSRSYKIVYSRLGERDETGGDQFQNDCFGGEPGCERSA